MRGAVSVTSAPSRWATLSCSEPTGWPAIDTRSHLSWATAAVDRKTPRDRRIAARRLRIGLGKRWALMSVSLEGVRPPGRRSSKAVSRRRKTLQSLYLSSGRHVYASPYAFSGSLGDLDRCGTRPRSWGRIVSCFLCFGLFQEAGGPAGPGIAFALGNALVPRRFRSAALSEG